jgi:hypothetical protein
MYPNGSIFQIKDTGVLFIVEYSLSFLRNGNWVITKYNVEISEEVYSFVDADFIEQYCELIGEL